MRQALVLTDLHGKEAKAMFPTNTSAGALAACKFGLAEGLRHSRPEVTVDQVGYVDTPEDNLLADLSLSDFAADMEGGAGHELRDKFRAVHSSAALVVNSFAPLRVAATPFSLLGHRQLKVEGFERKYPTGLPRAQPPHLDVVLSGAEGLVGIESKCLEYLTPKMPKFSDRYQTGIVDERATGSWYAEMLAIADGKRRYRFLDVAQLIKHAFGLANGTADQPVTLVYVYWEPMDAGLSPLFGKHRQEIAEFAERIAGGHPRFEALSYPELWEQWAGSPDEVLQDHISALRARYEVPAWAWEGVEWSDGRLRTARWLDEEEP
jgi:hypothetical protein